MAGWGRDRPQPLPVWELYRHYKDDYSGFLSHMHNLRRTETQNDDIMACLPLGKDSVLRLKDLGKPLNKIGEVKEIQMSVEGFVKDLLTVVGLIDPRFTCTMIPSGSFYEGTKISCPDEFDFMAEIKLLSFPHASGVLWHSAFPGKPLVGVHPFLSKYVFYDMVSGTIGARSQFLKHYRNLHAGGLKKAFWQLIDKGLERMLYSWPQFNNGVSLFKYNDHGPAVTLVLTWKGEGSVIFRSFKISVDIAPAIKFNFWPDSTDQSSANFPSTLLQNVQMKELAFHVVPMRPLWRASFSLVELDIMQGFKESSNRLTVYRLAKYFRDRGGRKNQDSIPSYILKTAFFFELEKYKEDRFWTDDCLHSRLICLLNCLERECERDDGSFGNFFISAADVVGSSREEFVGPAVKRMISDLTLFVITGKLMDGVQDEY